MLSEDSIRLNHMRDATREALSFVAGKTRDDLDIDRQLVLALVKSIEIIDLDILWQTVTTELPPLLENLEALPREETE